MLDTGEQINANNLTQLRYACEAVAGHAITAYLAEKGIASPTSTDFIYD